MPGSNAASVPALNTATFTPLTNVYVWLQANIMSATMITSVTSDALRVVFGGSVFSAAVRFDPNLGRFVPASSGQYCCIAPNTALSPKGERAWRRSRRGLMS